MIARVGFLANRNRPMVAGARQKEEPMRSTAVQGRGHRLNIHSKPAEAMEPAARANRPLFQRLTVCAETSRQTPSLELRAKMWPLLMHGVDQHLPSIA